MKKKIVSVLLTTIITLSATLPTYASETREIIFPDLRTSHGVYYDYLTIVTTDGNEWLLDNSKGSKYISEGKAIFRDKENVVILFDTMATEDITDDVILDVHSLDY